MTKTLRSARQGNVLKNLRDGISNLALSGALLGGAAALNIVSATTASAQTIADEIVVTAQRREQRIQDVPIAVTAVTGEALESIGAIDITEVSKIAPNTTVEVARGSNTTIVSFIRGVGQQDPLWGFEPGVGIYVDDIYIARPQGAVLDLFDVERIEVLRGPQGTLYGRNTIGGAIKYITKPLDREAAQFKARLNVGSYGQFDQIASGSVPVSDTLVLGAAIANYNRNGFGENLTTGEEHYDKDIIAGRVSAEWTPSDALNFRLNADITGDDSAPKHGHRLIPSTDGSFAVTDSEYDTRAGLTGANEGEFKGVSLIGSYDVNEAITLKTISAYREGIAQTVIDFDALANPGIDVPAVYEDDQFSQEFQLLYSGDKLSGVAGLYYFDGNASGSFDVIVGDLGLTIYQAGDQQKENLSAYLDFTYDVSDALSISLGGRYTEDKTVADVSRDVWLGLGSGSFDPTNTTSTFLVSQTGYTDLERKDSEFTPRVSINYAISDTTNVYGSFSQGFKAGGFDPRARADLDPLGLSQDGFGPETVDSYELGLKGSGFDHKLTYSIAAFFADYKDQQITVQQGVDSDNDNVNDTFVSSVFNAGKSEYKGVELEAALRVSDDLTLNAMGGYIDAEIVDINSAGTNIADQFVTQNTPELTARFDFMYEHDLERGGLSITGSVNYRDGYNLTNVALPANAGRPALDPEEYATVDLGAKWTSDNGQWDFGIYGRNLTDQRARIAAYNLALGVDGAYSAFYRAPRTVTASLGFKY